MSETVGVIGLGDIGRHIATHWIDDGFDVVVHDMDETKQSRLVEAGATGAASSRDLAEQSDVVFVLVGTGDDVESVLFDEEGVAEGVSPDDIVVVASTVRPERCVEWADRLPDGVHFVDAPLTLGIYVDERRSIVFAGGETAAVERLGPLFEAYTNEWFHLGDVGSGQITKTANNLLMWACFVADSEALRLGEAYGVDPEELRHALAHGSAQNYALETWRDAWERGGEGTWAEDDLRIVFELAEAFDVDLPQTERTQDALETNTLLELLDLNPEPYGDPDRD